MDERFSGTHKDNRDFRTNDSEPVSVIVKKLNGLERIEAVDAGCGAARYDMRLYTYFGDRFRLTCLDGDGDTLNNLSIYLARRGIKTFSVKSSTGQNMPFTNNSVDCVFTFNAVLSSNMPRFVSEGARIIRNGGYLFIYTRLQEEGERAIAGRHFPGFNGKEKHVSTLDTLKQSIDAVDSLAIESVVFFAYNRMGALEQLFHRAGSHNDSAFSPYTPEELEDALKDSTFNIKDQFKNTQNVRWYDENVLFVVKKEQKTSVDYLRIASSFQSPGIVA